MGPVQRKGVVGTARECGHCRVYRASRPLQRPKSFSDDRYQSSSGIGPEQDGGIHIGHADASPDMQNGTTEPYVLTRQHPLAAADEDRSEKGIRRSHTIDVAQCDEESTAHLPGEQDGAGSSGTDRRPRIRRELQAAVSRAIRAGWWSKVINYRDIDRPNIRPWPVRERFCPGPRRDQQDNQRQPQPPSRSLPRNPSPHDPSPSEKPTRGRHGVGGSL